MGIIIENIKTYFERKERGEKTEKSPEGECPTCWGHNEWDGQYYEIKKDKHLIPEKQVYESFISKIVDVHVNTVHTHGTKHICLTCEKEIA